MQMVTRGLGDFLDAIQACDGVLGALSSAALAMPKSDDVDTPALAASGMYLRRPFRSWRDFQAIMALRFRPRRRNPSRKPGHSAWDFEFVGIERGRCPSNRISAAKAKACREDFLDNQRGNRLADIALVWPRWSPEPKGGKEETKAGPWRETLVSTSRRDSLDMLDNAECSEEKPGEGEEIIFWRLGSLRLLGGLRDFDGQIFFADCSTTDLVGFSEPTWPIQTTRNGLWRHSGAPRWSGREWLGADAVETCALLAEIDGAGSLGKRMAPGVRAFTMTRRVWGREAPYVSFSKSQIPLFEGEADAGFAVGVGVKVDDADFLLLAAAFVDKKNCVAPNAKFGFQGQRAPLN